MRFSVATLGCKVNQYESRALEESLEARGHVLVPFGEPADAVVINTCTVTHRSDRDARALIRRARRALPGARIVVTGCYAQVDPQALSELGVDAVVGTAEKGRLAAVVEGGEEVVRVGDLAQLRELSPAPVNRFGTRARAFLKVQDGCACFCAYCIVPHARGPSRSLPLDEVGAGLARLRRSGYREVVLSGVHLGLWGRDLVPGQPFAALLDVAEAAGIPRIRLSSLEPGEVTPELTARLARSTVLCPHLHVPLQSGSDRILRAMGRPYTAAAFRGTVAGALAAVPGLNLGFDVIVGFPGEDEEAFGETVALLEAIPFAYLHVFPFSPRRGTAAWDLPGAVAPEVVKARAAQLRRLSKARSRIFARAQVAAVLPALAEGEVEEGTLTVRTRNYIQVRIPWEGAAPDDEVDVRIERATAEGVAGRFVGLAAAAGE